MEQKLPSTKILGTSITTAAKGVILEYILKSIKNNKHKFYIVTPNPEIITYASHSKSFQHILNDAEVSLPDGIGVLIAGRILKKQIIGRITGVDFMEELCQESAKRAISVGFLGGRGDVAIKTAECLTKKYPGLRVILSTDEWPVGKSPAHIDILFVAFGFPKQEEWIAKNLSKIDVTVAMGVGGAFDYFSGKIPRAPKFVRNIGLEWFFRLIAQPWRIKRQASLPVFLTKVLKEQFS